MYKNGSYSANFTETHIKIAKREVEENVALGQHLLQSQQAQILVAWWYWCHARWVEVRERYLYHPWITAITRP